MRYLKHAAMLAITVTAFLAATTGAMAEPAPGREDFVNCPDRTVDPGILNCFRSVVDGGHLQMGSKDTPFTDEVELVGGLKASGPMVGAFFDGGHQPVPGGLLGITGLDWLSWLFPFSLLTLGAEAELAGTPGNPLDAQVSLPLKVRLENALLTNNCYIGSNSNPIQLQLTQFSTTPPPPNQPIQGHAPTFSFNPAISALILTDGELVDNAFAAPAASGCGLLNLGLIDSLVNSQAGLPSPAGTNEAVQEFDGAIIPITSVYPPDGID